MVFLAPQSAFTVKCRKTLVSLTKDEESIGIVIRGGIHSVKSKSRPLTVTYVRPGGAADRWVLFGVSVCKQVKWAIEGITLNVNEWSNRGDNSKCE